MENAQELIAKLQEFVALYGIKVVAAIAILIIGRIVAGIVRGTVGKLMRRSNVDETLVKFVTSMIYITLMVFVVIAAVGKLGVQTTSFVAVIGAAGLAVGLALQGSLANFAAGVLMIIFRPFKVGDFVEAGGVAGVVESITIFTTNMKSPDNKAIIVPNAQVTGGSITNYSAKDTRRVDLVVGVGYGDDIAKVRKVLEEILAADERILKDPEPTIGLLEMADSSINFAVRPWVKTADYWGVFFDTNEAIKKRFDAEGIEIPFPQRDVHLYQQSAS